ncbi:MAG: hypothetical protein OXC31_08025 [Spirochaetaceae bacterium]|nr:hypothetical protein [Spirochaetaceae bacterium]
MIKWYEDRTNGPDVHLPVAAAEPVSVLNLSVRPSNCLRRAGIRTIGDLVERSEHDLRGIRGLGAGTLQEIVDALGENGLRLGSKAAVHGKVMASQGVAPAAQTAYRATLSDGVAVLHLGVRASNCLRSIGVRTIQDLVEWSAHDLSKTRNLGKQTLEEIVERLKVHDLSLRMDAPCVPAESASVPVLDRCIGSLELGSRAVNCLRAAGVRTVQELIQYSERQLLSVTHMGSGSLSEIVAALGGLGLQLRDPLEGFRQTLRKGLETADEELEYVVSKLVSPRNRNAVMLRLGWSGQPVCTLEELAGNPELSGLGNRVTRERVRQIEVRARRAIRKSLDGLCPRRVSDALRLVSKSTPIVSDEVPALLKQHGLSRTGLCYSGLSTIADLTEAGWNLVQLIKDPNPVLVSTEEHADYEVALKSLVCSRSKPFACVTEIVEGISDSSRMAMVVTRLVDVHAEYRWLDRDAGIFWNAARDSNKILYQCRKLFSLAHRLLVGEVHTAVQRTRTVTAMPPKHVLLEMLRQADWFEIHGDYVQVRDGINFSELSMQDCRLVRATKGMGRTVGFSEIRDNLVREGVSSSYAGQHILFSPFLFPVSRGRFRLLFDVDGARANATRAAAEPGPCAADGADGNGRAEVREAAGPAAASSVSSTVVPISSRSMITDRIPIDVDVPEGDWHVVDGRDRVGRCNVGVGVVRKLAPALRNGGAKVGDYCRLRFDCNMMCVQIEIVASDQGCRFD